MRTLSAPWRNESITIGDEHFGDALAIAGDLLIVGSPLRGTVCAFEAPSGAERWCVKSPRRHDGDHFGFALGVFGNDLVVGAPGGHRLEFGSAYLLDARTGRLRRTYHGPGRGSAFGSAVAVRRNRVLIGAPAWVSKTRGRTYLLDKRSGNFLANLWGFQEPGAYTGIDVAFVRSRLVIVDFRDDSNAPRLIRVFR